MALTFEETPQLIAFCDSPQYVVLKDDAASTFITLEIYIWQGVKGVQPTTPQRILNKTNLVADGNGDTYATFEVSNYISEFVKDDQSVSVGTNRRGINPDTYIPTTYGATYYNEENGTWFKLQANSALESEAIDVTKFATLGKGYFAYNINPGTDVYTQNNKVYANNSSVLVCDPDRDYIIPVYIGDDSTNNSITSGATTKTLDTDLGFILNSALSTRQIGYIVLSDTDWGALWGQGLDFRYYIHDGVSSLYYEYVLKLICGKSEAKSLKYLNTFGSVSDFPVNGSDRDSVQVSRTTFNNNMIDAQDGGYDVNAHVKRTFFVEAKQSVALDTGWIFEEANIMMQELLISKFTWYDAYDAGYPTHITNNSMRFINRRYGNQVGYNINIEIAQPLLNDVR